MEEKKRKRGQRGPGKKIGRRMSLHLSVQPDERELIRSLAKTKGLSISEFVLSLIKDSLTA